MHGTECFMVVRVNERTVTETLSPDERCDDPECLECTDSWDKVHFDVAREHDGEIIATDVTSWYGLPPGAMYFNEMASYHDDGQPQPGDRLFANGPHLTVMLPNGDPWNIDARAGNCDRPDDMTHRCWIRHGDPPDITVDKNGDTCTAGAGSIRSGDWHGYLRDGYLQSDADVQANAAEP